jgi:hypothetical protein
VNQGDQSRVREFIPSLVGAGAAAATALVARVILAALSATGIVMLLGVLLVSLSPARLRAAERSVGSSATVSGRTRAHPLSLAPATAQQHDRALLARWDVAPPHLPVDHHANSPPEQHAGKPQPRPFDQDLTDEQPDRPEDQSAHPHPSPGRPRRLLTHHRSMMRVIEVANHRGDRIRLDRVVSCPSASRQDRDVYGQQVARRSGQPPRGMSARPSGRLSGACGKRSGITPGSTFLAFSHPSRGQAACVSTARTAAPWTRRRA